MIPSPLEGEGEGEGFLPPRPLRERVVLPVPSPLEGEGRVRGNIQFISDLLQNCLGLAQYLVIPEAQNPIAHLGQIVSPMLIRLYLVAVMSAIKLNDQLHIRAKEVNDVTSDRLLATKLEAVYLSFTQPQPQFPFGVGLVATEALSYWV